MLPLVFIVNPLLIVFFFKPFPIIASSTGNPILGQIAKVGVDAALGSGIKKKTTKRGLTIKTSGSTLIGGVPQVIKSRLQGGSFKRL